MAARRPLLLSAVAVGSLALGCGASTVPHSSAAGSASQTPSQVSQPAGTGAMTSGTSTDATGTSGGIPVAVRARVDQASGTVVVDVRVTGPAQLLGGCEQTLAVHLVDAAGTALISPSPPGSVHCLALTDLPVPAGVTQDFTATLPLPPAHGVYTVAGQLAGAGAIPSVSLSI
jgi:hypothetical protein